MANHKSAEKRNRQNEVRNQHNKYYAKTMRNAVRDLRASKEKTEAAERLPLVSALIDKVAKMNIIHKNKAANLKSGLAVHVNNL